MLASPICRIKCTENRWRKASSSHWWWSANRDWANQRWSTVCFSPICTPSAWFLIQLVSCTSALHLEKKTLITYRWFRSQTKANRHIGRIHSGDWRTRCQIATHRCWYARLRWCHRQFGQFQCNPWVYRRAIRALLARRKRFESPEHYRQSHPLLFLFHLAIRSWVSVLIADLNACQICGSSTNCNWII